MINLIYKQGFKLSLRYITSAMKSSVLNMVLRITLALMCFN